MLVSRKINFKHHDLLTVQMLESMQNSTLESAIAPYLTYADGIISGLSVSMDDHQQLHITPGTVKWNGQLYIMTDEQVERQMPRDCSSGWVILLPQAQQLDIALVEQLPEDDHIVLAAFSNRDTGSVLKQPDQLKKMQFVNYFDASAVRLAGADGQLTYDTIVAQCFAKELLAALGADANDFAFAWQALQVPPTKTMWTLYLQRNEAEWTEDGERFVEQLLQILKKKEKPLPGVQMTVTAEKTESPEEKARQLIID